MVAVATVAVFLVIAVAGGGGGPATIDIEEVAAAGRDLQGAGGDPFAYSPRAEPALVAGAAAGEAHVLYAQSPGGVVATAERADGFRDQIEDAVRGTDIDPDLLEALVFLESAGRPQVSAGKEPGAAAGLTQIVGSTGTSLLGMQIDIQRSHELSKQITEAEQRGQDAKVERLIRERAAVDPRFDPEQALAGTVRYLQTAERTFGRPDLAIESYHMGIGNLENVIRAYTGDETAPVASLVASGHLSYARLFFDSSPAEHSAAWDLLGSFGDESSTYLWKLYGALQIISAWRENPDELQRIADLQTGAPSQENVFHEDPETFQDQDAVDGALDDGELALVPVAGSFGCTASTGIALRPKALASLVYICARVRALNGGGTLIVIRPLPEFPTTGWTFDVARDYESKAQAEAFQFVLDRMRALDVIDYAYEPGRIHVATSNAASALLD